MAAAGAALAPMTAAAAVADEAVAGLARRPETASTALHLAPLDGSAVAGVHVFGSALVDVLTAVVAEREAADAAATIAAVASAAAPPPVGVSRPGHSVRRPPRRLSPARPSRGTPAAARRPPPRLPGCLWTAPRWPRWSCLAWRWWPTSPPACRSVKLPTRPPPALSSLPPPPLSSLPAPPSPPVGAPHPARMGKKETRSAAKLTAPHHQSGLTSQATARTGGVVGAPPGAVAGTDVTAAGLLRPSASAAVGRSGGPVCPRVPQRVPPSVPPTPPAASLIWTLWRSWRAKGAREPRRCGSPLWRRPRPCRAAIASGAPPVRAVTWGWACSAAWRLPRPAWRWPPGWRPLCGRGGGMSQAQEVPTGGHVGAYEGVSVADVALFGAVCKRVMRKPARTSVRLLYF